MTLGDVTFGEYASQTQTHSAPENLAAMRVLLLNRLRACAMQTLLLPYGSSHANRWPQSVETLCYLLYRITPLAHRVSLKLCGLTNVYILARKYLQ